MSKHKQNSIFELSNGSCVFNFLHIKVDSLIISVIQQYARVQSWFLVLELKMQIMLFDFKDTRAFNQWFYQLCRSTILRLNHWAKHNWHATWGENLKPNFLGKWIKQSNAVYFEFVIANNAKFVNNNFVDIFKKLRQLNDEMNWFLTFKITGFKFYCFSFFTDNILFTRSFRDKNTHHARNSTGHGIPLIFSLMDWTSDK